MNGLHLLAEFEACASLVEKPALWASTEELARVCRIHALDAGLCVVGEHWHQFECAPGQVAAGATGVLLLAESHLALHTWPELSSCTLDIYVCHYQMDNSDKARHLLAALTAEFAPARVNLREVQRGSA